MLLNNKRIAFGITSSFYAMEKTIPQIKNLIEQGAQIIPIMSFNAYNINNSFIEEIEDITKNKIIHTIEDAEPIGYKIQTDIMVIIPCTGNTIAKLANGILDTPVLVSAKTNFKCGKNIVIGIATNDGLSIQAENIGKLLKQKNIFFVPFRQDNPITKPSSLLFSARHIQDTIKMALNGEQIQPLFVWFYVYNIFKENTCKVFFFVIQ